MGIRENNSEGCVSASGFSVRPPFQSSQKRKGRQNEVVRGLFFLKRVYSLKCFVDKKQVERNMLLWWNPNPRFLQYRRNVYAVPVSYAFKAKHVYGFSLWRKGKRAGSLLDMQNCTLRCLRTTSRRRSSAYASKRGRRR